MFKNFLQVTFRNFLKNKFFVIINVIGLGIALASCIVAYYNYRWNVDFDKVISHKNEIYKVGFVQNINGRMQRFGMNPLSLKPAIGNSMVGVDEIVRVQRSRMAIRYGDKIFSNNVGFADENMFSVFDYPFLRGDANSLNDARSAILTEEFAQTCFGDKDPIGEMISVFLNDGKERTFKVSGIIKDLPENTSFQFSVLTHIDNLIEMNNLDENNWRAWISGTFLLIKDKKYLKNIEDQLQTFIPIQNKAREDLKVASFHLEPMKVIPNTARNTWNYGLNQGLHPAAFAAPSIMAILILLLACLNFTNTALAISSRRLKEIGLRKVMGGLRIHTMIQFLGENIVLCFIALLASLLIGSYLIDEWSKMWEYTIAINFADGGKLWFFLFVLLIITGLAAGSYPAFYVSKFNPINILKGNVKLSGAGLLSKILLVIQFLLAVTGIISTVIFTQNAKFQENLSMGYAKDKIIAVPFSNNPTLELFRNTISQNPMINKMGWSEEHVSWSSYNRTLKWGAEQEHEVTAFDIGKGYFETMGFELVDGRNFDQDFKESEREKAIIVNEKLVEAYGWESAIGQRLRENDTTELTVVGVVRNFYPFGFWNEITPTMLKLGVKERMRTLVVQSEPKNLEELNKYMREEWEKLIPNAVYPGFLQEERLAESKSVNNNIIDIFLFLAVVSVLLSLVGLYTLVSLKVIKRTKEIGIRKVLGAPVFHIISLLNREFIYIIFISSVLGSVLGHYLSEMLLSSIYQVYKSATISTFIIPTIIILSVSVLTIIGKVYKAASKNPVDAIKYE